MNDRIQSNQPGPNPSSDEDEYYAVNLRKPRSGIPGWVWVLVALPVLVIGGLFCAGLAAGFLMVYRAGKSPPPVVSPALPAPGLPAPHDGR
jgi:hypothetical protein